MFSLSKSAYGRSVFTQKSLFESFQIHFTVGSLILLWLASVRICLNS